MSDATHALTALSALAKDVQRMKRRASFIRDLARDLPESEHELREALEQAADVLAQSLQDSNLETAVDDALSVARKLHSKGETEI